MQFPNNFNNSNVPYFNSDINQKVSNEQENETPPIENLTINEKPAEADQEKKEEAAIPVALIERCAQYFPASYHVLPLKTLILFEFQELFQFFSIWVITENRTIMSFDCKKQFFEMQECFSQESFSAEAKEKFKNWVDLIGKELGIPASEGNKIVLEDITRQIRLSEKKAYKLAAQRLFFINLVLVKYSFKGNECLADYLTTNNCPRNVLDNSQFHEQIKDLFELFKSDMIKIAREVDSTQNKKFILSLIPKKVKKNRQVQFNNKNHLEKSINFTLNLINSDNINSCFKILKNNFKNEEVACLIESLNALNTLIKIVVTCRKQLIRLLENLYPLRENQKIIEQIALENMRQSLSGMVNQVEACQTLFSKFKAIGNSLTNSQNNRDDNLREVVNLQSVCNEILNITSHPVQSESTINNLREVERIGKEFNLFLEKISSCIQISIYFSEALKIYSNEIMNKINVSKNALKLILMQEDYEKEKFIQKRKKVKSKIKLLVPKKVEKGEKVRKEELIAEELFKNIIFPSPNLLIHAEVSELQVETQKTKKSSHVFVLKKTYKVEERILSTFKTVLENSQQNFRLYLETVEAYKDSCYHLKNFSAWVDLLQLFRSSPKTEEAHESTILRACTRSLSLMAEQLLTARLLEDGKEHYRSHYHMEMLKKLEEFSAFEEFFNKMNYGGVFTRYPNQTLSIFEKEEMKIPLTLNMILEKGKMEKEAFDDLILDGFQFLKACTNQEVQIDLKKEKKALALPNPQNAKDTRKKLDSLINKGRFLIEKYKSSLENSPGTDRVKDILYHLNQLLGLMTLNKTYLQTQFLAAFGDGILTHLQYLDELIQEGRYYEEHGTEIFEHDLEQIRDLRGCLEEEANLEAIQALNTIYGAQYPNRRSESIKGFNKSVEAEEKKASIPDSLKWRFKAQVLAFSGEEIDSSMTHYANGTKINRAPQGELLNSLITWTNAVFEMAKREFD